METPKHPNTQIPNLTPEQLAVLKTIAAMPWNDPDMRQDDEFGWLHKDVLASVNELRAENERLRKTEAYLRDWGGRCQEEMEHQAHRANEWRAENERLRAMLPYDALRPRPDGPTTPPENRQDACSTTKPSTINHQL